MLLSLMGFVQYSQLVLSKASYEIQTLLRLGYSVKSIVNTFIKQLAIIFGLITAGAIAIMLIIKLFVVNPWLDNNGIHLEESSIIPTIILALICFGLFIISNLINIRKTIRTLGKNQ
jgi:hypothetical protein